LFIKGIKRGEAPSLKSPLFKGVKESQREAKPPLYKLPFPLLRGRG